MSSTVVGSGSVARRMHGAGDAAVRVVKPLLTLQGRLSTLR